MDIRCLAGACAILILTCSSNLLAFGKNYRTIRVAIYDYKDDFNKRQILMALRYEWTINNTIYRFSYKILDKRDILSGKLDIKHFDILIISSSAKPYLIDGQNRRWKEAVRSFVKNGGGYLGICGGAVVASRGFRDDSTPFHRFVNRGTLGIADVHINDDLMEEWQYLFKIGKNSLSSLEEMEGPFSAYPSLSTVVLPNPIVPANLTRRSFGWGGGPGMYILSKSVRPMLLYNEEPMETKPINFWMLTGKRWIKIKQVKTDINNTFAAVMTTYGNGRIVIFGNHPEYPFVFKNGSTEEHIGQGFLDPSFFRRMVYNYIGNLHNFSYNIWVVRRSIAWAAGLNEDKLPPCDETSLWIIDPDPMGGLYLPWKTIKFEKRIGTPSFILKELKIRFLTSRNVERIEFYLDGKPLDIPYSKIEEGFGTLWETSHIDLHKGYHVLLIRCFDRRGNFAYDELNLVNMGSEGFEPSSSAS